MHHAPRRLKEQSRVIFDVCRLCNCYRRRTLFTCSWHSSFYEIVDRFIHFCNVWPESIWNTLQEFYASYFAFQMVDEIFNLSLLTMTMRLYSKEGDLVHLTTILEFLLVDKLLSVISSDCFWLVAPKSDRVEDVWKNVPAFLARNYTYQVAVRVHDDEGNCFLFVTFRSLVHDSVIKQP